MPNPLFQALNGGNPQGSPKRNMAPNLLNFIQGFQGNPIQTIQDKMNSGEMTQEQYNQLYSAAQGIAQKMMGALRRK